MLIQNRIASVDGPHQNVVAVPLLRNARLLHPKQHGYSHKNVCDLRRDDSYTRITSTISPIENQCCPSQHRYHQRLALGQLKRMRSARESAKTTIWSLLMNEDFDVRSIKAGHCSQANTCYLRQAVGLLARRLEEPGSLPISIA